MIVVGPHNMSVVKGTTSGTRLLVLLPWDLCITLSIISFSGLEGAQVCRNLVPVVCKGSGNIVGAGSNIFSCMFFFLALLLVTLLESSSEIPPLAFICSRIQRLEGVFM